MNFSRVPMTSEEWVVTIGQTPIPLDIIKSTLITAFIIGVFFIGFQLGDFNKQQFINFASWACPSGTTINGVPQKCVLEQNSGSLSWNCSALEKSERSFNISSFNTSAWK